VSACITVHAQEAVGEHAALQISPKLALHESRYGSTLLASSGKEGLEVFEDHLVEQCAFRLVPLILDGAIPRLGPVLEEQMCKEGAGSTQIAGQEPFATTEGARPSKPPSGSLAPQASQEAAMKHRGIGPRS
jgi:hypothetical protein